ncbi:MAG: Gfo/Idh/MocA family oxidoreductase [Vicingaceae bacterium]
MEQLTQNLKDGKMELTEVPFPALKEGSVLVRTHYSVISPGTEGKTVKDARLSYLGKAKARQEEVKKVIASAKTFGVKKTYEMVMNKLEAYSPLGYSCSGEVIALANDVRGLKVGDQVACGGGSAGHSEVVCVPQNLCVKLPEGTPLKEAAFTTMGAIAMQGFRQAELNLGESCLVIGLGIIGQLSMQILQAAGIQAIGIDIDEKQLALAQQFSTQIYHRNHDQLAEIIERETHGHGVDAVLITASTSSTDPVDFAGEVCRKKGKVIIVGAVPTGFARKNYFKKELDLRMSSSYGPGRYESNYEEKGLDYPISYVRWTENRNMQSFVQLIANKSIDLQPLITHQFSFKEAPKAYQTILDGVEVVGGMVLEYDSKKEIKDTVELKSHVNQKAGKVKAGLIGAGSFAQNFLLPVLKEEVELSAIATARSNNARYVADKYQIPICLPDAAQVPLQEAVNTVFILSRHDTHAQYVTASLKANKNVYVEKPLCLKEEELEPIKEAYKASKGGLMVGFNRRFAPQIKEIKDFIGSDLPKAIHYRINAGNLPAEHWVHDPEVGGGRIIGEACHFIDLCRYLANSEIESVSAEAMEDHLPTPDKVVINLKFKNGSVAGISYFANGSKALAKEYLEVHSGGKSAVLEDFKSLSLIDKKVSKSKAKQDKGYQAEIQALTKSISQGKAMPIPFEELYEVTLATFKVLESIKLKGERITL